MKRLIIPTIISLATLGSLISKVTANAAINAERELDKMTELTTVETENTSQLELSQINSDPEEIAYNYCNWEVYPDGSYAWICW